MYSPKIRKDLIQSLYKLGKLRGKPMTEVVDEILRGYLEKAEFEISNFYEESPFIQSLGKYRRPRVGERIKTRFGKAEILGVKDYSKVVEDMRKNGVSEKEIERFGLRVENFLMDKNRYFECLVQYKNGELDSIDWSEYLAVKNKRGDKL